MHATDDFTRRLAKVSTIRLQTTLVRIVPHAELAKHAPPDFLMTSGKPNRLNPPGIECVYFSEDETTANKEFERPWKGLHAAKQPKVTFFADVRLDRVLDLTQTKNIETLKISTRDLHMPWRGRREPTLMQQLGQTVCSFSRISAIRFPSDAMSADDLDGCNVVIYRRNVVEPDSVIIRGHSKKSLQKWP
ncbi:MAG: RES family NAD+ phosphorylase [Verrucomicrobiae bacterium]|nr:RES family NAD+ phosphorylase [Verrucomicrobiae bacterium]